MRFWDASAIVPLLVDEQQQASMRELLEQDADVVVWWATSVECMAALARRERDGSLEGADLERAVARLMGLAEQWHEVLPGVVVRRLAYRMLRVHPMRAADALQLAAAMVAAEQEPASLPFVCLDELLMTAALKEGFTRA